ncbi:MAG TPA: hypothetical protein VMW16_06395 [Sedimentisphaerales bacterium]|nr:hypothetical protein [Sedimentisphaerales bacterium]
MKKCLFLIPTSYNDGRPIPSEVMMDVFEELFVKFGPFSQSGVTKGLWEMEDGTRVKDNSLTVWIVIEEEKVALLKELVKKFARLLEQEAIYFEVMDCDVEFIGPE